MEPANTLRFALSDRIQDAAVAPAHVPLTLLGQFQKDVSEFLAGSDKDVDLNQVIVAIEEGSLSLVASGLLAATSLWADVERLHDPAALGQVDPKRVAVVARWQATARKHPHRGYTLADQAGTAIVRVDADSDYRDHNPSPNCRSRTFGSSTSTLHTGRKPQACGPRSAGVKTEMPAR